MPIGATAKMKYCRKNVAFTEAVVTSSWISHASIVSTVEIRCRVCVVEAKLSVQAASVSNGGGPPLSYPQ